MQKTQKKNLNTDRIGFFNFARGIGMISVVLSHSQMLLSGGNQAESVSGLFLYAPSIFGGACMVMFFMISGYGFMAMKPKKCIKLQTKMIIKPYYIAAACVLLSKLILAVLRKRSFWDNGGEYIFTYLFGFHYSGGGMIAGIIPVQSIGICWFVLALYGGWIMLNGIMRLKNKQLQPVLVAVCFLVGSLLNFAFRNWPFCIPQMLLATGWLYLGYIVKRKKLLSVKLPWYAYLLLLPTVISAAYGRVDIADNVWKLWILDMYSITVWGFVLLKFFAAISDAEVKNKAVKKLWNAVDSIGYNSIWVIWLHGYESIIFPWYRLKALFGTHIAEGTVLLTILRGVLIYVMFIVIKQGTKHFKAYRKKHRREK